MLFVFAFYWTATRIPCSALFWTCIECKWIPAGKAMTHHGGAYAVLVGFVTGLEHFAC